LRFQEFWRAGLRIGATAKRQHDRFAKLEGSSQGGPQLRGFQQTEGWFAVAFKKFGDAQAGSIFDAVIEIDKSPCELPG
jgi:hypothetical protein